MTSKHMDSNRLRWVCSTCKIFGRILLKEHYGALLGEWRSRVWAEKEALRSQLAPTTSSDGHRWTDSQLEFAFRARDEASFTIDVISTFTWWKSIVEKKRQARYIQEVDQWKGHFILLKKNIQRVESLTEDAMYLNLQVARCVWHWSIAAKHAFALEVHVFCYISICVFCRTLLTIPCTNAGKT